MRGLVFCEGVHATFLRDRLGETRLPGSPGADDSCLSGESCSRGPPLHRRNTRYLHSSHSVVAVRTARTEDKREDPAAQLSRCRCRGKDTLRINKVDTSTVQAEEKQKENREVYITHHSPVLPHPTDHHASPTQKQSPRPPQIRAMSAADR